MYCVWFVIYLSYVLAEVINVVMVRWYGCRLGDVTEVFIWDEWFVSWGGVRGKRLDFIYDELLVDNS